MDKVSSLVRPDSLAGPDFALRRMYQSILPITAIIWAANWGILVSRAYALGIGSGWKEAGIRLVISIAGAASCLPIYKLLQHRVMTPLARFGAAFLLALPADMVVSFAHEALWLSTTQYYVKSYGFGPQDVLISQCGNMSSPCGMLLLQSGYTTGTFIWVYVTWCAFYVGLTMTAELREREVRLNLAERTAQQAQLSALRFQLNPHFMFNTLNTLSGLIALDRKRQAEDVVLNLSSFLRFSLQSDTEQLISLDKEIEAQKMYPALHTYIVGEQERLARLSPCPVVRNVANAGHYIHRDQPREVLAAIYEASKRTGC